MYHRAIVIAASLFLGTVSAGDEFKNPNYLPGRDVLVYLLEWKWNDIAVECERFLGPKGFGGVQTSPVTENVILHSRTWLERYQPISYRWITRSGNEQEFRDMVWRCNRAGVRVYVDVVLNHMTADVDRAFGTGGSTADTRIRHYPAVPYNEQHFHPRCEVEDSSNATQLRNCRVLGHDLNQEDQWVWMKAVGLLTDLIDAGVAGFRIDSATYMWPHDLENIYHCLHSLNTSYNFSNGSFPYIYQEVKNFESAAISMYEYNSFAAVTDYKYNALIRETFGGRGSFSWLNDLVTLTSPLPSNDALVFVSDLKTERIVAKNFNVHQNAAPYRNEVLMRKTAKIYKMSVSFMLAHPYGNPMVMSTYAFADFEDGPPDDWDSNIISPITEDDSSCADDWICEHRWLHIYNMVAFRNTVRGTGVDNWWENGAKQLAFSRGDKGFIAINGGDTDLVASIPTNLPAGIYCDVISGSFVNDNCSGKSVTVKANGDAYVVIPADDENGVVAIHLNAIILGLMEADDLSISGTLKTSSSDDYS